MILITGGSGMIGRALTELMLSQGKSVRVQVRDRIAFRQLGMFQDPNLDILEADFSQVSPDAWQKMTHGCDTVIHTAALVHKPDSTYSDYELHNVRATQELAEAAKRQNVTNFVFLSTIAVYGDGPFENVKEDNKLNPVTPYAVSKLESEKWLHSFNGFEKTIVFRPSMVFGEGDRGQLLKLIRQINKGIYFNIGPTPAYKSLIYSKDLCQAIDLSLRKLGTGFYLFNVANPHPISLWDLSEAIGKALKKKSNFPKVPKLLLLNAAKITQLLLKEKSPVTTDQIEKLASSNTCCIEELQKTTGFLPAYDLHSALAGEIAWAQANGKL